MKALRLLQIAVLLLGGAVLCYAQHGRGSGHMGGPPMGEAGDSGKADSSMGNTGNSGKSDHGSQAGTTDSDKRSVVQMLDKNTKLTANLQKLLPSTTTPQQVCGGFKNLGQCVAAIHVSHNLGISIIDLQSKLTGKNRESLGKAIRQLRPDADAGTEKKKAEKQAKDDMNGSES